MRDTCSHIVNNNVCIMYAPRHPPSIDPNTGDLCVCVDVCACVRVCDFC